VTVDPPVTDLLDVNVLVALAWEQHVHHGRCHRPSRSPSSTLTGWLRDGD